MFTFGQTVTRLRAPLVVDPYSGEATERDWANAVETTTAGFGLDPGGSVVIDTVNRTQYITTPTLIWSGADVPDVQPSDRVRDNRGRVWHVKGYASDPQHPMTGWQPGATWPLERVEG